MGKNKPRETILERELMAALLDKDLKTTVLTMCKALKEDMGKVKKMIHEQNRSVNEETESLKSNQKEIWELKTNGMTVTSSKSKRKKFPLCLAIAHPVRDCHNLAGKN